ncbi:MAG: hypothetical protein JSR85_08765 [Proteobacteria bacterium]|nr:hypothetical protein [Pseudomonadota bacterium]
MNKSRNNLIKDFQMIYDLAISKENYSVALKAKELIAREHGLFSSHPSPQLSLSDLSDEDIARLIKEIQLVLDQEK